MGRIDFDVLGSDSKANPDTPGPLNAYIFYENC
jgi:hypothetical protein